MFFAVDVVPPPGLDGWLSSAFWVCGIVAAVMHIVDRLKPKPALGEQFNSFREWVEEFFATKVDLSHSEKLFAERCSNLTKSTEELIREMKENERVHEERSVALHNRINVLLVQYGEMKGISMRHSQSLRSFPRSQP